MIACHVDEKLHTEVHNCLAYIHSEHQYNHSIFHFQKIIWNIQHCYKTSFALHDFCPTVG